MSDRRHHVDPELVRRLEEYAAARLSPDEAQVPAVRARVIREAEFVLGDGRRPTPLRPRGTVRRRFASVLLAAALGLSLAVGGVALGAEPGGPLYGVIVWWETTTLPAAPDARAAAEIHRLDQRLVELQKAIAEGDPRGAAAAAAAYRSIVDGALASATGDEEREHRLEGALTKHVEVLTSLLDKVPDQARGAIENAIGRSDRALDDIRTQGSEKPKPGQSGKPGGSPNGSGDPPGQSENPKKTAP